ncbi:hypothetical protein MLD38_017725 [Melastoma candidum]|uniref:Uncharacterized protein n=1 Tax=Melastoma candidum TaxID=119954 RepID=A0ACB9QRM0_9MYRT|nr:hypothetical protein MLD38_017725 [Melastoma candidum]
MIKEGLCRCCMGPMDDVEFATEGSVEGEPGLHSMGWLTKFFGGSSRKRHYHAKYQGNHRIDSTNSEDELTDIEREQIEYAIALSRSEEDQKGKNVVEDEAHSEKDEGTTRDESDDEQSSGDESEDEHVEHEHVEDENIEHEHVEDEHIEHEHIEDKHAEPEDAEPEHVEAAENQAMQDELVKAQLEEDEQLAKALQSSLCTESPPRNDSANTFRPFPFFSPFGYSYRTCAGCNALIMDGRFLSCIDSHWHPECFCCHACKKPIKDREFSVWGNRPFHKSCYKEQHHPKCDVCTIFIPANSVGLIEYRAHPFWLQKYCPSHEKDGTPRCCSCERMEPRDTTYLSLDDGRRLCLECLDSAIMDTHECQPLFFEIREFYEGLNMKIQQDVPLLLVERQALNEAMEGEKNGHHHMPETRGLCLSEEQCVTTIIRRPRIGAGHRVTDMITEPFRLVRRCEVTAILILYGLPRLLTGSILAHEMMHAWLRLNGYPSLSPEVEEGICQVLAHMWIDSEIYSGSGRDIPSSSSSSASSSSSSPTSISSTPSKKGRRSDFEKVLGEFFKHQIESDTSAAYGAGFRTGNQAVLKYGLRRTLDHIKMTGSFPV